MAFRATVAQGGKDREAEGDRSDALPMQPRALISQYIGMRYTADCKGHRALGGGGHVWQLPFRQVRHRVDHNP